jgi:hypothetical protein
MMNRPRLPSLSPRLALVLLASLSLFGCSESSSSGVPVGRIKHVFIIMLENKSFDDTFGPDSEAPYLANDLAQKGQLLRQYFGTAHVSLPNYIALISGQAPNRTTQGDCSRYTEFEATAGLDGDGQAVGNGCVYPSDVLTIADQLEEKGLTWGAYLEDMGNSATEPKNCRHPTIGEVDPTTHAKVGDQYATRHNPFVYFHSVIDSPSCAQNNRPLTDLPAALASEATTPNYVFISPNLCNDGHDTPCVDGAPGGLVSINGFLETWVPQILASEAYKKDGLLVITFDEADLLNPKTGEACCNEPTGPNVTKPGIVGPGGGRIGALLISPLIEPGTVNDTPYNHYALLRTVEDLFEVPHLGFAGSRGLRPLGSDVFSR